MQDENEINELLEFYNEKVKPELEETEIKKRKKVLKMINVYIRIDVAIAICHSIEEYDIFRNNLEQFSKKNKNNPSLWKDLKQIVQGKIYLGKRELKKFYQENQMTIDTITKYTSLEDFLFYSIEINEIGSKFCQYIKRNKVNLDQILAVLNQIKKLGFSGIELDETNDFTRQKYKVYKEVKKNEEDNNDIYFLENLKRIPTYGTEIIKYQSQGSNYKIQFHYSSCTKCLIWASTIFLNNLTFDVNLLPTNGHECNLAESMWKKMMASLGTEKEIECSQITNAINLNIELANLAKEINAMEKMLKNLSSFQETEELNAALLQTKVELTRMKQISEEYDRRITDNDSSITEDVLKRERNREQSRRNL